MLFVSFRHGGSIVLALLLTAVSSELATAQQPITPQLLENLPEQLAQLYSPRPVVPQLVNEDKQKERPPVSFETIGTDPKSHFIFVQNRTRSALRTAVRYKNTEDEWVVSPWITLNPGGMQVVDKTHELTLAVYAEAIGASGPESRWSGDEMYPVEGSKTKYGFREEELQLSDLNSLIVEFDIKK